MRRLDNITDSTDVNLSKVWETVKDGGAWCAAESQTHVETEQHSVLTPETLNVISHQGKQNCSKMPPSTY